MERTSARCPPTKAAITLIRRLRALSDSGLSALRRAGGKSLGSDVRVFDIFRKVFGPVRRRYATAKWACYLVATLYPWHPEEEGRGDFGECLARIRPRGSDEYGRSRADQRLTRLLDCRNQRALFAELAACVRAVAGHHGCKVPVDWARLLEDLAKWYEPGQPVQKAWAASYFVDMKGDNQCRQS